VCHFYKTNLPVVLYGNEPLSCTIKMRVDIVSEQDSEGDICIEEKG
jgi:hypothetical protein